MVQTWGDIKMSNTQLSSKTDQWGTPAYILEKVRNTLITIDIDPASCHAANKLVMAKKYFSKDNSGLSVKFWSYKPVSVFINPPSGKLNGVRKPKLFWEKLIEHQERKLLKEGIFLGFSLEQLAILQDCYKNPLDFTVCFPRKRIKFINLLDPEQKDRPTHSNFICYIHGTRDNRDKFYKEFHDLGHIIGHN